MKWSNQHDIMLLREMLLFQPWSYRYGSVERGQVWETIADSLNRINRPVFKVNQRSVRDRYHLLKKRFLKQTNAEHRASGISPEETEIDKALQNITEQFREADTEHERLSEEKKRKAEEDVTKAEEFRKKSMETLSETQNRTKKQTPPRSKRPRNGGSDAMTYLREKAEKDATLKETELEMQKKQAEKEAVLKQAEIDLRKSEHLERLKLHEDSMKQSQSMLKQLTESQTMQQQNMMLFMQQQQQQNALMLRMMEKLADKGKNDEN